MSRCKISWRFLFIGGSKSFFVFLESECSPWSIGVLEELFWKNLCKIIFFMAYSPKMARIDKNGQKVRLMKLKDEFSAWKSCYTAVEARTYLIFCKKITQKNFDTLYRPRNGINRPKLHGNWIFLWKAKTLPIFQRGLI